MRRTSPGIPALVLRTLLACTLIATRVGAAPGPVITEGTNLSVDVAASDGRVVMDLLGRLWLLPARGGAATALDNIAMPARSPRWSPSESEILYESTGPSGPRLWLYDVEQEESRPVGDGPSDQQASWHPSGERIVFSAPAENGQLDLWELDIATGLRWRLTHTAGDETEAAWSANGRHLAYVLHDEDGWALMLRRRGSVDTELLRSGLPLRVPSWRPDGSLITFLRSDGERYVMGMVILSDPPLVRDYSVTERDLFMAPVAWRDRYRMVYAADGKILQRRFDDRRAQPLQFLASLDSATPVRNAAVPAKRSLPVINPADQRLVIRAARLFDGIDGQYRTGTDVVIEDGKIADVAARRDWPEATVLDLGDATLLPGFVDAYSSMPRSNTPYAGAGLLSWGVTTLVTDDAVDGDEEWHGEQFPGPRVVSAAPLAEAVPSEPRLPFLATLPHGPSVADTPTEWVRKWQQAGIPVLADNWTLGLGLGADLLLGADTLPRSPRGQQYQDMRLIANGGPVTLVSGLADASTPGMRQLLTSRQAIALGYETLSPRRLGPSPNLMGRANSVVAGSKPSGLPPGLALHAELRALAAAGLDGRQVLQAAGINAARILGLDHDLGRIAPGALADMVLVSGDPLHNVSDSLRIVAVVRNGRFYSLSSLLERATSVAAVEYFDKSDTAKRQFAAK